MQQKNAGNSQRNEEIQREKTSSLPKKNPRNCMEAARGLLLIVDVIYMFIPPSTWIT